MLDTAPAPTSIEGYDAIVLRSESADLEAAFVPRAGNVMASLTDAGQELLGRRDGVARYARGATTMGVPLLHPWANRLGADAYAVAGRRVVLGDLPRLQRDEHGLPIHGVAGGLPWWDVEHVDAGHLRAELEFGAHDELLAAFPFPHRLTVDATLRGRRLTIATVLEPTGSVAVPVAFGFHPYLRVPGVRRRHWFAELPALRRLELDGRGLPTGRGTPQRSWRGVLGARTFDDAFAGVRPGTAFAVAGAGRRIEVTLDEGYPCAQVFAPPDDDVICFEPMTAPTDALRTGDGLALCAPGDAYTATFSITVDRHMA
jgi:aldose 1-epimerase